MAGRREAPLNPPPPLSVRRRLRHLDPSVYIFTHAQRPILHLFISLSPHQRTHNIKTLTSPNATDERTNDQRPKKKRDDDGNRLLNPLLPRPLQHPHLLPLLPRRRPQPKPQLSVTLPRRALQRRDYRDPHADYALLRPCAGELAMDGVYVGCAFDACRYPANERGPSTARPASIEFDCGEQPAWGDSRQEPESRRVEQPREVG